MEDTTNYRGIPAVPQFQPMVTTRVGVSLRQSRALDYVKTDKRYLLELQFNRDIDLAFFERFILGSSIRIAEYAEQHHAGSRIFLVDSRIRNDATVNDVWKWADEELSRIQAAVAIGCPEFQPAICVAVVDLNFRGGGIATAPPIVTIKMPRIDRFPEIDRVLQSTGDLLNPYIAKCSVDHDFSEAMTYCGRALGIPGADEWANLYRAYEVVADHFGGDDAIVHKLKGCAKNKLEHFKRTVNHQEAIGGVSRHARLHHTPPPNPMDFVAAVKLVLDIMAAWLRWIE
jgi:hypothetical protein